MSRLPTIVRPPPLGVTLTPRQHRFQDYCGFIDETSPADAEALEVILQDIVARIKARDRKPARLQRRR